MKEWLRKAIFASSALIFIVSCILLIKLMIIEPSISKKINEEAKSIYYNNMDSPASLRSQPLVSINSDIKGWIKIDNTVIDYPVVQSEDPYFYLNHNYKKESSNYGSIFIDSNCKEGVNSKNIILHGHHMRDGQMFADLMKFSDFEFYKACPIITFNTNEHDIKWKIISIFKTNTRPEQGKIFNYLVVSFANENDFLNYIYNVKIRSLIDTGVNIASSDQIITLSTCSYEFDDFRTVLVARKIRAGEEEKVDLNKAKISGNPLMPDCWYREYGGTPPSYSDFDTEYKAGKINWLKIT